MNDILNNIIIDLNEYEVLVLMICGYFSALFIFNWYRRILFAWPFGRAKLAKFVLAALPPAAFCIIFYTLKTRASHDVINDPFYLALYSLFGTAWLYFGIGIMSSFFNLSWADDILSMNNKAALVTFTGGFFGLTVIYAASNIGDGPGWACVLFTGGLGLATWVILALIVDRFTHVFEKITIERDISCGIRIGCFLLATAIIMGKKLAGDWFSVHMTLVDFIAAMPALASIIIELLFPGQDKPKKGHHPHMRPAASGLDIFLSVVWGATLLVTATIGSFKIYG